MSKENYSACVAFVLKAEGGNTDTPGDRGGRTGRGGITHETYDAYRAKHNLPAQDVFKISTAEIADIYKSEYWDKIGGDSLPAGIDLCLFDYSINSGPGKASAEHKHAAATGLTGAALIRRICSDRLAFLQSLGSWGEFGKGWSNRVAACQALALKMSGTPVPVPDKGPIIVAGLPAGTAVVVTLWNVLSGIHLGPEVLALIGTNVLTAVAAAHLAWELWEREKTEPVVASAPVPLPIVVPADPAAALDEAIAERDAATTTLENATKIVSARKDDLVKVIADLQAKVAKAEGTPK